MTKTEIRAKIISVAASLLTDKYLSDLYGICEKNKTVSTRKLELMLDNLSISLKTQVYALKKVNNELRNQEKSCAVYVDYQKSCEALKVRTEELKTHEE